MTPVAAGDSARRDRSAWSRAASAPALVCGPRQRQHGAVPWSRCLAIAALASACGSVAGDRPPPIDGAVSDVAQSVPVTYRGRLAAVPPVRFGGNGTDYCMYDITF